MKPADILNLDDRLDLFDDGSLTWSDNLIARGLVPPLPVASGAGPGGPILVWGWALARRAHDLAVDDLPTREVTVNSPSALLAIALDLEGRKGSYDWGEQCRMVEFVNASVPSLDGRDRSALSRLVRGDRSLFDSTLRFQALRQTIKDLVVAGAVNLTTGGRIGEIPDTFFDTHAASLASLSFSARRQFLETLSDLLIHTQSRDNLLGNAGQALGSADPVGAITAWRYPKLTAMTDEFQLILGESQLGSAIEVRPPPYFEGDEITVRFGFRSCQEMGRRVEAIERLRESCDKLLGLL